jgi:hypothetical protein
MLNEEHVYCVQSGPRLSPKLIEKGELARDLLWEIDWELMQGVFDPLVVQEVQPPVSKCG